MPKSGSSPHAENIRGRLTGFSAGDRFGQHLAHKDKAAEHSAAKA